MLAAAGRRLEAAAATVVSGAVLGRTAAHSDGSGCATAGARWARSRAATTFAGDDAVAGLANLTRRATDAPRLRRKVDVEIECALELEAGVGDEGVDDHVVA